MLKLFAQPPPFSTVSPLPFQLCWFMLNRCWMSLKAFKLWLCCNSYWTFLVLSRMLNEVKAIFPPLSTLLGMHVRTNRSLNDTSMSVSLVTTAPATWHWIPGLSWSFVELKLMSMMCWNRLPIPSSQHRSTKSNGCISKCWSRLSSPLRTVPSIVIAHTFCTSRDTRISYGWCFTAGIFLRGSKLCGKSRTQQVLLVSKKKIGGNHAFFRDN